MAYNERRNEKSIYIEYNEEYQELDQYISDYLEEGRPLAPIQVIGEGGVGKSTFLINSAASFRGRVWTIYIEVSACTNEVEIMKLLVDQLRGIDKGIFRFNKFRFIYDWFYGEYSKKPKAGLEEEEKLRNVWEDEIKNDIINWENDFLSPLSELIFCGKNFMPFGKTISTIVKLVKNLKREDKALDDLCAISERVESERSRRKALKEIFIKEYEAAIPQKSQMVIIMDNFCLKAETDFTRDLDWLVGGTGLLEGVSAAWIIGSRREIQLERIRTIRISGFTLEQAKEYIQEKRKCLFTKQEKADQLLEKMLQLAKDGDRYLPYKLNIIVNHYWELKDKRGSNYNLTIDDFHAVDDELVSEYFYMDLPEYRFNAAQILSCMDTWNEKRLDIVRKRFNDILLNARHLLQFYISLEDIGNGNFKLHESIKDALYENNRNVIKFDVQEFVFKEFCDLFLDEERKELVMRDLNLLSMYVVLSVDYLKKLSEDKQDSHRQMVEDLYKFKELAHSEQNDVEREFYMFFQCLKTIYDQNCKPEIIFEDFVYFYETIIDGLKKLINYPGRDDLSSPLYIRQRKMLADLYTNISRPDKAEIIEKECLEQAEQLYNQNKEKGDVDQLFLAEGLLLECRNAYAYDKSFKWQYNEAYEEGKKGLDEASGFICTEGKEGEERELTVIGSALTIADSYIRDIKKSEGKEDKKEEKLEKMEGVKAALEILNKVYDRNLDVSIKSNEFPDDEAGIDDNAVLYEDLVDAFLQLLLMGKDTVRYKLRKKGIVLIDMLFNYVNKLRGNFPWYCINEKKEESHSIIQFAIKTYLIRKAQNEALQQKNLMKGYETYATNSYNNSLVSYHNLGVYYFRLGQFEKAFEIGTEACFRRMQSLKPFDLKKLNDAQSIRYEQVKNKITEHGIFGIRKLMNISVDEHLQANNDTLESIQYLGNYLLYKKKYRMAVDKLGEAYINRYIRYGMKHSKTLDCGLRLAVAVYACNEDDLAAKILDDVCKNAEEFLGIEIAQERFEEYTWVRQEIEKIEKNQTREEREEKIESVLERLLK